MLEQELASIFSFILKTSDNPMPYYRNLPQDFCVPAAYFPIPEITTDGDTFGSYGIEYNWYVKFIHSTTQEAYAMALKAITAIKECRNLIPLLSEDGKEIGIGIRIYDPAVKPIDDGIVQLLIRFVSRRPYKQVESIKMQTFEVLEKQNNDDKSDEEDLYNGERNSSADGINSRQE